MGNLFSYGHCNVHTLDLVEHFLTCGDIPKKTQFLKIRYFQNTLALGNKAFVIIKPLYVISFNLFLSYTFDVLIVLMGVINVPL